MKRKFLTFSYCLHVFNSWGKKLLMSINLKSLGYNSPVQGDQNSKFRISVQHLGEKAMHAFSKFGRKLDFTS